MRAVIVTFMVRKGLGRSIQTCIPTDVGRWVPSIGSESRTTGDVLSSSPEKAFGMHMICYFGYLGAGRPGPDLPPMWHEL